MARLIPRDLAQMPARQIVYLESTAMFLNVAEGVSIRGLVHTSCQSTRAQLAALGLEAKA